MTSVSEFTHSKEISIETSGEAKNRKGLKESKIAVSVFKVLLCVLPLLLAGDITAAISYSKSAEFDSAQGLSDLGGLVTAIKAHGNMVRVETCRDYTLFPDIGNRKTVRIGREFIEVFIFNYEGTADGAASSVSRDGFSVTNAYLKGIEPTSIANIGWIDEPHFYKNGRLIAVYIGHDTAMEELLTSIMGPQFAGQ